MSTEEHNNCSSPEATPSSGGARKRIVLGILLTVLIVGGASIAIHWWTVGRFIESTDDAYAKADIVFMAPQVGGTIANIHVADNAHVNRGDALFGIDPSDYQAAVRQATANVAIVEANSQEVLDRIELQTRTIAVAKADLASALANQKFATEEYERSVALHKKGNTTLQRLQSATTQLAAARAATAKVRAVLARDQQQFNVLRTERTRLQAQLALAQASLQTAQLALDRTIVQAPVAGTVGNRQIELGELVQPGVQAISVVPDHIYVLANFKETQIEHMHIGMEAQIHADMLGGKDLQARIESLAPASGSEFAILPPQNATGNFTKIVQRVPVKLEFTGNDDRIKRLKPGTSLFVKVDTKDTAR